jgi:hypothetical protein
MRSRNDSERLALIVGLHPSLVRLVKGCSSARVQSRSSVMRGYCLGSSGAAGGVVAPVLAAKISIAA